MHARLLAAFLTATPDPAGEGALAARHGLLPLYRGWGGFIGLAADGELYSVGWDPPHDRAVVREPVWRRVALVRGAAQYPELAALRPVRAADAVDCPGCHGTGRPLVDGRPLPGDILCQCAGLGWVPPDEAGQAARG